MKLIGVDVGGTKISAGLVIKDKIIKKVEIVTNSKGSEDEIVAQIKSLIDQLMTKDVKAIGIGVPAIVDTNKGILFEAANIPSWKKVNLKSKLSKYKIPIYVNNDANCFVLGEKHHGLGKNYNNFVGTTIGTGIGSGIIINGKLYEGNSCSAGEFGQFIKKNHDVDYFASGSYFLEVYNTSGKELLKKANKGNGKAKSIFKKYGKNLGYALSLIVNSVDPELMILGGAVTRSYPYFKDSMLKELSRLTYKRTFSRLKIKVSKNKSMSILGAAALYYNSKK